MEKLVNEITCKLDKQFTIEQIEVIKDILYSVLKDYIIEVKNTDLMECDNDLPKELKIYLVSRKVDGLSEGSLKQYHRTLTMMVRFINKPLNEIKTEDIRLFLYSMKNGDISNRTLDTQRSYINAFFAWLNDNSYIEKNPCSPIKPFKYEKKVLKELTDMEMEKLRLACKNEYETAIIEVLYSTGCRVNELVNIKLEDIDISKGEITILHGKGNKQRMVYLNAKAILAINNYVNNRDYKSVWLFENDRKPHGRLCTRTIERKTKELENRTGIKIHPHKVRRTMATHLWNKGMPLEEIRTLLGHENISTTLVYTNVNQNTVKADHQKYLS